MTAWRKKAMHVSEWGKLQDNFETLFIATGATRDAAMFKKSVPSALEQEIYITGPFIGFIEASSPGGWEDSEAPAGEGISLLIGHADAWDHFGITFVGR